MVTYPRHLQLRNARARIRKPDFAWIRAMSPSTTTPQDAYKGFVRPGWFTCRVCIPNLHERGGQAAFYAHWLREHHTEPDEKPAVTP